MGVRDILVLTLLGATLPVCFFKPFFGILMWEIVSFLNPQRFTFGAAANTPVAMAVAIPTLLGFVTFSPGWKYVFSRDLWLLVVLWLWLTTTTIHNTSMAEFAHFAPDTWFRWQFVSKVLLMTVITIAVINGWGRFRWLLLVLSLSFGFIVLKAVPFMIVTGGSYRLYGPSGSMIADNNDLGLALNMTLPMFFFLGKREGNKYIRWLMRTLAIATIPAILFTYSRGALLGLSVVLFLMVMTLRQRLLLIPLLMLSVIFAVFATPQKWQDRMNFTREGTVIDDSALSRFNAWHYCWNLVLDHPLFGAGFDAFTPSLFSRYAPNPRDVHGPHSIYFGVLAEQGFPGLFLYLTLIASSFCSLYGVRRYARIAGDSKASDYALMLQFSLIGFLTSGAFLGRAYFDYFFTIVAAITALKRLTRLEPRGLAPTSPTRDRYGKSNTQAEEPQVPSETLTIPDNPDWQPVWTR